MWYGIAHFGTNKHSVCSFLTWDYELVGAYQALHIITYNEQVAYISRVLPGYIPFTASKINMAMSCRQRLDNVKP